MSVTYIFASVAWGWEWFDSKTQTAAMIINLSPEAMYVSYMWSDDPASVCAYSDSNKADAQTNKGDSWYYRYICVRHSGTLFSCLNLMNYNLTYNLKVEVLQFEQTYGNIVFLHESWSGIVCAGFGQNRLLNLIILSISRFSLDSFCIIYHITNIIYSISIKG